jgi:hypothetical protein
MNTFIERSYTALFDDYDLLRNRIYNETLEEFISLIHNAITIENLPLTVPEDYVLRVLLRDGKIAVYNEMWLHCAAAGTLTLYGKPTKWVLRGENNAAFNVQAGDVAIIKANDAESSMYQYLETMSGLIASAKVAMIQNIKASQRAKLLSCDTKEESKSLERALEKIDRGETAIVFRSGMQQAFQVEEIRIEYLADRYSQIAKELRDEVLTRVGILSANTNKRERVQSAEVYASVGEAYDSIKVLIDTFNRDAEKYGIEARMVINAAIQDLYLNEDNIAGIKENEKDEE